MKRPVNGRFPKVHAYGPDAPGPSKQRTLCQTFMATGETAPQMATGSLKVTCGQCLRRMKVVHPPKEITAPMDLFDAHRMDSGATNTGRAE